MNNFDTLQASTCIKDPSFPFFGNLQVIPKVLFELHTQLTNTPQVTIRSYTGPCFKILSLPYSRYICTMIHRVTSDFTP